MEYVSVSSSNIEAIGYDEGSLILGVRFNNGSEYHYYDVDSSTYQNFLSANSKGSYLNSVIKAGGYSYQRVG